MPQLTTLTLNTYGWSRWNTVNNTYLRECWAVSSQTLVCFGRFTYSKRYYIFSQDLSNRSDNGWAGRTWILGSIRRMALPLMISIGYFIIFIFPSISKSFFSTPIIDYRRTTRTYLVITTILPIFLIISRTSSTRTRPVTVTILVRRAFRSSLIRLCPLVFIGIILVTLYNNVLVKSIKQRCIPNMAD